MSDVFKTVSRGPMIHIRLDEKTHRLLKILAAQKSTSIQQLVEDLIQRETEGSDRSVRFEVE